MRGDLIALAFCALDSLDADRLEGLCTLCRRLNMVQVDLTERIDTNAYCILMARLLPEGGPSDPETMHMKLSEAINSFNDHHANS